MRYPEFIKPGDRIAFVAPAFGCNEEPYKSAFKNFTGKLEKEGYKTILGPNCYKDDGIGISTSPIDCAEELEQYYMSEDNDAIISCGGGELMCETISNVDFKKIASAKSKWYMGYSDNTHMTFLLTTICDVASVYGPNAPKMGMEPWHESIEDAWKLLCGKSLSVHNYESWEKFQYKKEIFMSKQKAVGNAPDKEKNMKEVKGENIEMSGRLIGGCMDCLVGITGTRFDKVGSFLEKYKEDGFIWFLESCDLTVFSIRRAMWQMYEAGWFKYCKGMLIGRPLHFDEPIYGLDQYEAVLPVAGKLGIPVIMDCDIGHLSPQMPLICGSMADVSFKGNSLNIRMRLE